MTADRLVGRTVWLKHTWECAVNTKNYAFSFVVLLEEYMIVLYIWLVIPGYYKRCSAIYKSSSDTWRSVQWQACEIKNRYAQGLYNYAKLLRATPKLIMSVSGSPGHSQMSEINREVCLAGWLAGWLALSIWLSGCLSVCPIQVPIQVLTPPDCALPA